MGSGILKNQCTTSMDMECCGETSRKPKKGMKLKSIQTEKDGIRKKWSIKKKHTSNDGIGKYD